jgi:hypothetical protein
MNRRSPKPEKVAMNCSSSKALEVRSRQSSLSSGMNAIIKPKSPIVEVTLQNPFNLQDFKDDKLSILDILSIQSGWSMASFGQTQPRSTIPFVWPTRKRGGFCRKHWRFTHWNWGGIL